MALGDTDDMIERQRRVLPPWFPDTDPVLRVVLAGFATIAAHAHALIEFARRQLRLRTVTGGFLDLAAYDFFGLRFRRRKLESDTLFRARVLAEIVRPRNTRASVIAALVDLTGEPPFLYFEPSNPRDTGGYNVARGYNMAGRYGSLNLPNQVFVIPFRPRGQGVPNVMGYGPSATAIGGLGQGRIEYVTPAQVVGAVTDADIYAAVESVRPAGVVMWVSPQSSPPETFDSNHHLIR